MKRFAYPIVGVILAGVFYFLTQNMTQKHNQKVMEAIQEAETGVPAWNEAAFKEAVEMAKTSWVAAENALKAHDLPASFAKYHAILGGLSLYLTNYSTREIGTGVTLRKWFDEKETAYRAAVLPEFDLMLEKLAEGQVSPNDVRAMMNNFGYIGFKDLEQRFKAEEDRIIEARAKAAKDWVRLMPRGTTFS